MNNAVAKKQLIKQKNDLIKSFYFGKIILILRHIELPTKKVIDLIFKQLFKRDFRYLH